MAQSVEALPGVFTPYTSIGWRLAAIQPGSKAPCQEGWNKAENAIADGSLIPQGWSAGLQHGWSGTMAVDVDDLEQAQAWLAMRGINLQALFDAPDSVIIDSGTPGHGKLLYRMPLGLTLASKKVVIGQKNIVDFRCASSTGTSCQDLLPPSRHPSGSLYRWAGKGNWRSLPIIPPALLAVWQELLGQEQKRDIPMEGHATPASLSEVRDALYSIDPSCDRKSWIAVGMALQVVGESHNCPEIAYQLWNDWSQGSHKYVAKEMVSQWRSFKPKPAGITTATLFHFAYKSGWTRPPPDLDGLFKPVEKVEQAEVKQQLSPKGAIPTVDLSLWPPMLVRRAREVAKEVGCDPVVPLMAGLCAVSGALDKRTILKLSATWDAPSTIWIMTLGEPSDKKSPGSRPMFKPLYKLEAEHRPCYRLELLAWQGAEARHAHQMKLFREWQENPDSQLPNSMAPQVDPIPPKPEPKVILLNDSTTQKLVVMSENRPQGFLLWLDEMNTWLRKLADPRTTDDRGCWIKGYDTGPYSMHRMGSGSLWVEHMAVSLYGNCQPEVFRKHAPDSASDGILQRFLPVALNPENNAVWQDSLPSFMSSESEYEQLIRTVHGLPTMTYRLSDKALAYFREFSKWTLEVQEHERLLNHSAQYQTSLGKMDGNCARIIQLFHVIENPHAVEINENTCWRAIEVMKRFFYPSMRYAFLEIAEQRDKLGEQVFDAVLQVASAKTTISLSELRRGAAPKVLQSRDLDNRLRVAMDDLSDFGFVSMFQDHPRSPVWAINPAMATMFENHRRKIIEAKQSIIERLRTNIRKDTGCEPRNLGNALGFDQLPPELPSWMR